MILKRITSILLTATILSQSILPAFAMEKEGIISKKQGRLFSEKENISQNEVRAKSRKRHEETNLIKQRPLKKTHNNLSPEIKQERELVTKNLRSYLSQPKVAGVVIQPLDWVLFNEDASVASELLKDDSSCTITSIPLELVEDEDRRSDKMDSVEIPVVSATRDKRSKRVVGKKGKTASGILHYALFEGEILIPLGNRNDNQGWCHSGGESEDGESPHETASRESKEELIGTYVPHPDLLSHQPFIDTITEKNNDSFFYRLFFQKVKYLPSDVFKKKLVDLFLNEHSKEFTDIKWVKASDLWGAVATGNNILQVDGESIQLYGPMFQTLSTKSGQSILCKLWLDKTLNTTPSDIYFSARDSFNQCYQIGNKWSAEEFAEIQKEFYLPKSTESSENNKILATAVAAHGMAMVQLKRKFQEIESPTAPKTALWNPKCEKTLSQIHLAMVLGDQYKEAEDFKGDPNPRRAANIENIRAFITLNNDSEYWQEHNQDRKIDLLESDYGVLADILDWDDNNKEWPTFIHGTSDRLNNLFKAFTYLRELIGVRSLKQLVSTRGTDIYFKQDKTIWDMINRTGPVQNNETSNAMMFLNFVIFATCNTTNSTSSSVEYYANNHSVTLQDMSARFEEAMALCGFSKPDYSYFHSLFEQFYKHQHPTFENSVLIAVSQNPVTLDDYNYPTLGGGSFLITSYQDTRKQDTSKIAHALQNEFEQQRQREQKLQWEFEHPLGHENSGKLNHSKPQAQSGRVRFDSFKNDTERKKSLMPENRRFLQPDSFLNLDLIRSCPFDRFPLSDDEKRAYDAEMRKTTVHIIADWLAEHTQSIPGSFKETPVIKKIYTRAYEKITGEKPKESLPIDGFIYLAQNSNKETVEGFITTCMEIFEGKNEILPLPMALNFLSALIKYGNLDLFNKILKQFPDINMNHNFPNINYSRKGQNRSVPLFNMLNTDTPNFTETVKFLIDSGVNKIDWIPLNPLAFIGPLGLRENLAIKILNELVLYQNKIDGILQIWFNHIWPSLKKEVSADFTQLLNTKHFNLISLFLDNLEDLKITSFLMPEGITNLSNALKSNKNLKNLSLRNQSINSSIVPSLAEGLRENTTLEQLSLSKNLMFGVMNALSAYEEGAFRNAPWFKEMQLVSFGSLESIQYAINERNWPYFTNLVKNSTRKWLDLTNITFPYCDSPREWLSALIAGLRDNPTLHTLTPPHPWMLDIMVTLISSPQGPFTRAPWFCDTWEEVLSNPAEYLQHAALEKNDRAFLSILKAVPKEVELVNVMHRLGSWFTPLMQEVAQDEPYLWLNLSGRSMFAEHMSMLADALKTNTKLKSLNLTYAYSEDKNEKLLAEGLKDNTTLEKLSLSNEQMISVMGFLMESPNALFRQAPWFAQSWQGMLESPEESIKAAYESGMRKQETTENLIQKIAHETQVTYIDLTKITSQPNHWRPKFWIKSAIDGLGSNQTIQKLKIQLDEFEFETNTKNLTEMLQENSHLTHLDLGIDCYYDQQLDTFLKALREIDNLTLKTLDLSNCTVQFQKDSLASLEALLSNKPSLTIFVSKNMFGDEDLTKICHRDFNMSGQLFLKI